MIQFQSTNADLLNVFFTLSLGGSIIGQYRKRQWHIQ